MSDSTDAVGRSEPGYDVDAEAAPAESLRQVVEDAGDLQALAAALGEELAAPVAEHEGPVEVTIDVSVAQLEPDGGVPYCPACEGARVRRRPGGPTGTRERGEWWCRDCSIYFQDPEREDRETQVPTSGLARALVEADPDAVPDGGQVVAATPETDSERERKVRYLARKWAIPRTEAARLLDP